MHTWKGGRGIEMDIDFVVLWVDGNDPEWQKERAKYDKKSIDESNAANRFRDWGLMKYWFRGVEKFAPWVRKVHFVTYGHLPDFLDTSCPKLNIVNHRDYLAERYLPTFNSHTLEMNMHRIPDLAEHFVYFNDDTFLLRPTGEDYFFDPKTGLPKVYCVEMPIRFTGIDIFFQKVMSNDLGITNKNIGKKTVRAKLKGKYLSTGYDLKDNLRNLFMRTLFPEYYTGFKVFHCPASFCISTFRELWEKEPELLERVSMHKFRDSSDVNQWLALYWQMAKGDFSAGALGKDSRLDNITDESIDDICAFIRKPDRTMMCINDPDEHVDFEKLSKQLIDAFENRFPEKCSFEK